MSNDSKNKLVLHKNLVLDSYMQNSESLTFNMPIVNPNSLIKTVKSQNAPTSKSASFVIQQVGNAIDMTSIKLKPRFRVVATGHTYNNTNKSAPFVTPPYLLGMENFCADNFAVNKWISKVEFGELKDEERDPAMFEIQSMGFDIDKCEEQYGQIIGAFNGFRSGGLGIDVTQTESFCLLEGQDLDALTLYRGASHPDFNYYSDNFVKYSNFFKKNRKSEFFSIESPQNINKIFTTTAGNTLTDKKASYANGLMNYCAYDVGNTTNYYSADTATLTQTFDYVLGEYLVSKKLKSSRYNKNWQPDIHNIRKDQIIQFNLTFNEDYFQRMFLTSLNIEGNAGVYLTGLSVTLLDFEIEIESYNPINLQNPPLLSSTIYFREVNDSPQTVDMKKQSTDSTIQKSTGSVVFARAGRSSLPPYIVIFGDMTSLENRNTWYVSTKSGYSFADIKSLSFTIGSRNINILGDKTVSDLLRETADLLRNPEVYDLIANQAYRFSRQEQYRTIGTIPANPSNADPALYWGEIANILKIFLGKQSIVSTCKLPFIILDLTKLNLDYYDGAVPLAPMVNYGNTLSYTLTVDFGLDNFDPNDLNLSLKCVANCVELFKYKYILDLYEPKTTDAIIEFDVNEFMDEMRKIQKEQPEATHELQVAGAWFQTLMKYIPPVKKTARFLIDTAREIAPDNENLRKADALARQFGVGRRGSKSSKFL